MRIGLVLEPNGLTHDVDLDDLALGGHASTLDVMQGVVHGPIECIGINHEFDMFLHEEAKYTPGLERNPIATVLLSWAGGIKGDYVLGTALFVGAPDDEGETVGLNYEQRGTLLSLFHAASLAVGPTDGTES